MKEKRRLFLKEQINLYKEKLDDLEILKNILKEILYRIVVQCTSNFFIQTRVKTLFSFAEKIVRQPHYKNPVEEMTDLCGARVILPTLNEVRTICKLIEENFIIDEKIGGDKLDKFKSSEFGYLSTHYSVKLKPDSKIYNNLNISKKFIGFKAEVQIRTFIQHAWATIYHDSGFKGKFELNKRWDREFFRLAAILEEADESFSRIQQTLQRYESSYGEFMNNTQIKEEIERMKIIYSADPENQEIAHKISKMAMCIGDWEKAIKTLQPYVNIKNGPILRDLGVSMVKFYPIDSVEFIKGSKYLEEAIRINPMDYDAFASLGGYWKNIDEDKARFYYKQAFEINPSDPYCLGNYLIYEIRSLNNLDPISLSQPMILNAIEKCNDQFELEINLPWAYFDKGLFNLLLGNIQDSLNAYSNGLKYSTDYWMIQTTLKTLNLLNIVTDQIDGIDMIKNLLLLGLVFRFKIKETNEQLKNRYEKNDNKLKPPIVILAGSTSSKMENKIKKYEKNLIEAFKNFNGTIISGGTRSGISGLVGSIQEKYPTSINTCGYVPEIIPYDDVEIDTRYKEIRKTTGKDFSFQEALRYWLDIWASNIDIRRVKLLGIAGGKISSFEYRLALILGIKVGFLEDSGGETEALIQDQQWQRYVIGKNAQLKIVKTNVKNLEMFLPK